MTWKCSQCESVRVRTWVSTIWSLVSWMPKGWSCRPERNLHPKYQHKNINIYIYIQIWFILLLLVSICAVDIWLSMSNPRYALCIAVLGKMHSMCSRDRYYFCSDRIKRCSGAMFNNELLPLKWENFSTLPSVATGRLRGKPGVAIRWPTQARTEGCQLVNPQLFPLKSHICQMWPICWTTWDVLYYNYGDMYVQVIVMLLSTFIRTKIPLLVFTNRRYCFRDHIKLLGDDSDSTYHATLWRAFSDCTKNWRQFIECRRMFIKGYTGHAPVHQPIKTHY